MSATLKLIAMVVLISSLSLFGQGQAPPPPATDTVAPNIPGVVAGGTRVQVIKEGLVGTEGPIAFTDGSLLFTETDLNRITRIDKDGSVSTFLENTHETNGLAFDSGGRLIGVARAPGHAGILVLYPKDKQAVLTDNFEGKPFGRPNDLVVDKKGGVYFTDPSVNPTPEQPNPPPKTLYYLPPGGKTIRVAEGIERPNGVQLSRDERTLYLANTPGEYLLAFDIQPDGTLRNRRDFAKLQPANRPGSGAAGGADGIAIDNDGRIYVATTAGVQVLSEQGQHLGTIPVSRSPQNIAFAGPDKKTLYIVGRGAAYKVQMLAQGFSGRVK